MDTHLVLGERHVDEDVANEDKHYAQHCEWKGFSVVVEILSNVHVVKSD